jgi:hypothetical protein
MHQKIESYLSGRNSKFFMIKALEKQIKLYQSALALFLQAIVNEGERSYMLFFKVELSLFPLLKIIINIGMYFTMPLFPYLTAKINSFSS